MAAMKFSVAYSTRTFDFDVGEDRVVADWSGPDDLPAEAISDSVAHALDHPLDYPPLTQSVVPGDRVVVPLDPSTPAWPIIVRVVAERLASAGVAHDAVRLVSTGRLEGDALGLLPPGVSCSVHDPAERKNLAYLASTPGGTRVYLNRAVVEADFVIPIGRIGFDRGLRVCGPWSVVFPGMSDRPRHPTAPRSASEDARRARRTALGECRRINWLLGSRFQVGTIAGTESVSEVLAGDAEQVLKKGARRLAEHWVRHAPRKAELVVAGVGGAGAACRWDDVAAGLDCARHVVRQGGRIVLLTNLGETPGHALRSATMAEERGMNLKRLLRQARVEPEYRVAVSLFRALEFSKVYLLSVLPEETVEELGMVPLARPEEARRLVAAAQSCLFLSRAEETLARLDGE
jgi:hypothetical protein